MDPTQGFYAAPNSAHSGVPHSPVLPPSSMSPNFYQAPTFYYANNPSSPTRQDMPYEHPEYARSHQPESSGESSSSSRPYTSDSQHHQTQQPQEGIPLGMSYGQYPQAGMSPYLQYALSGGPQGGPTYANYEVPSNASMSPVKSSRYGLPPSSARSAVNNTAVQSPYRTVPFGVPASYATPSFGSQQMQYPPSTADQLYMASRQSLGSSTAYQNLQTSQMPRVQQPLQSPPQPSELARGHFAQAKLRDAAGAYDPNARLPLSASEKRRQLTADQKMPRPPSHSPWALWVGNVPSDSTHAELWRFFSTRPPPGPPQPGSAEETAAFEAEALFATDETPKPDYNSCGIDSIHLISRSNCCFVNMSSKRHLEHAIKVCNGLSLRPGDPRCKNLVCRVRKKEDDNKTGVGAQRGKGMHQAWAAEQEQLKREGGTSEDNPGSSGGVETAEDNPRSNVHISHITSNSVTHSASTSSTTSSFLGRNFPKRYFILKVFASV